MTVIKHDQNARLAAADVFDRVSEALRDIANVALAESLLAPAALRAEEGHVEFAAENVLPLGSVGVSMQLTQRAGFHMHRDTGNSLRDW
jgi:hypothetical protein